MKIQNIFSLLTLACFTGLPHALAEEGFTFTEEEVAAAEQRDAQRELQSMINDGALFLSKNRKAYHSIVSRSRTFAGRYSDLTTEKYHQATNFSQSPAELHTDIVDYFTGDMRFSPSAGQFLEGPLSHSTLEQARRNLTEAQYREIRKNINRCELLAKFWTGKEFAEACGGHDDDWFEWLQKADRFKTYLKSCKETDEVFAEMVKYFKKDSIHGIKILYSAIQYRDNERGYTKAWIKYFGTSAVPSIDKTDKYLSRILFDDTQAYSGSVSLSEYCSNAEFPRLFIYFQVRGLTATYATHAPAISMREYMAYFKTWDKHVVGALKDMAEQNRNKVTAAVDAAMALKTYKKEIGNDATDVDAAYSELIKTEIVDMLTTLYNTDEFMYGLEEHIQSKYHYLDNVENGYNLQEIVQKHVRKAVEYLFEVHKIHLNYNK